MFKRLILYICFIVCAFSMKAQTMEWLCKPQYDDIEVLNSRLFIAIKGDKCGILNNSGKLLHQVKYDLVTPFQEGRALLLNLGAGGEYEMAGLIDESGKLIRDFDGLGYRANPDYPFYKEGKLVFLAPPEGQGLYKYGYLDLDGQVQIPARYTYAAPFNNGKAVVRIASTREFSVINVLGGTAVSIKRPLHFLSTIEDGYAIGWRHTYKGGELLLLKLNGDTFTTLKVLAEGTGELTFPEGDFSLISYASKTYKFDSTLRHVATDSSQERTEVPIPKYPVGKSSKLTVIGDGLDYGLVYDGEMILLPIYAEIVPLREKIVSVMEESGKVGLLRLNENSSVSFIEPIRTYELRSGVQPELSWGVQLVGIAPEKISVILIHEDSEQEITLPCYTDEYGHSKIVLPYEFISDELNKESSEVFGAIVCVDGIPTCYENIGVTYMHCNPIKDINVSAPQYTDASGYADVQLTIATYENLSSSGRAIVSLPSGEEMVISLSGKSTGTVNYKVFVPENQASTFTFYLAVIDGYNFPPAQTSASVSIKNYYLQ
jgi:hypothetical protein